MKLDNVKPTKYDNLYTKEEAIRFLYENLGLNIKNNIWECACGEGAIYKFLEKKGHYVIGTDIKKYGYNFLTYCPIKTEFDIIITNPPYSKKNQFLKRAFEIGKPFAFLLPLTTLEGNFRNKLFRDKNIQLLIPNKRFDFTGKKNCWFATAWFCWKCNLPEQLNFREVKTEHQ